MARHKKSSPAEDVVAIVAAFPWWVGIVAAVLSYLVLHSMALTRPVASAANPGQIADLLVGTLKQNLAAVGQYLVPFFCLIGAAISASRRRARTQLIDKVVADTGSSALKEISWREFEQVVGEAFRLRGYSVLETGGGGADGGVDLVLHKEGKKFLVQCKQWRALKVGVTVIRELYGVMAASGAAGGFVVTCGQFTEEAKAFAQGRNLKLIDGPTLEKLIRQTRDNPAASRPSATATAHAAPAMRQCPKCGNSMLLRTAQRGANAGKRFWGCSSFPDCRGLVPVD
jgi:restriction system protein